MKPDVSIIIPTNRHRDVLDRCLTAITRQDYDPESIEVMLILNGAESRPVWSPDNWPFDLIIERIDEPHIGAAKNIALDRARGEWIVFLNDDVLIEPEFVAAHLAAHQCLDRPAMVLGRSDWVPVPDETLFDRMIQTTSMVFFYDRMAPHEWYGFRHAWNLNLSIHRRHLEHRRFDERLGPFFYEDLELAYRLQEQEGLGVWYAPEAAARHDHRYTLDDYLDREFRMGQASVRLWTANPDCYRAIYHADLDDRWLEYCRRYVEIEGRYEDDRLDHLLRLSNRSPEDATPGAAIQSELVQVLYDAHLPLKRLAFRRGVLHASRREPASVGLLESCR
jgi:GT2 family glycosyltransferase